MDFSGVKCVEMNRDRLVLPDVPLTIIGLISTPHYWLLKHQLAEKPLYELQGYHPASLWNLTTTMKRLFFGLKPDQEASIRCSSLMRVIGNVESQVVPVANLHVTLMFLGLVSTEQENALIEGAATITPVKTSIHFDQLSYWEKPGILCLTASDTDERLLALVKQLMELAEKMSVRFDGRPYQAHVTLARKAKQPPIEFVLEPIVWRAKSFCLYESCPTDDGVAYHILKEWSLI